ncbi:MAG: metal ABC transporter solute-binding protein, Zn/Mn family [Bacteroidota bacterium]
MYRLTFFLLLFGILITFGSCGNRGDGSTSDQKKTLSVSIPPQKYFVRQIAGNKYKINVMIPPGANPVTYDPSPGKMKEVSNSVGYVKIGHLAFEKIWMDKFTSMNPEMKVVDQSKYTELIQTGKEKNHHNHDHGSGVDPHIWTSPKAVKKQIKTIKEGLAELDPDNESFYTENYRTFLSNIDTLDTFIEKRLTDLENESFMIFHPALSYFARDYGLNQISIEFEGKEPSPSKLREIIDQARKENVSTIFIQKQFDINNAETVAAEIGGNLEVINPLDSNWVATIKDITEKMVSQNK